MREVVQSQWWNEVDAMEWHGIDGIMDWNDGVDRVGMVNMRKRRPARGGDVY